MAIKFLNTVQVDTDVLYVDAANDKVGIGTTSPSQPLHVNGNARVDGDFFIIESNPQIFLSDTNHNSDFSINLNSGLFKITDTTNSSDRITLDSSGNVGIGISAPATKLHIGSTSTGGSTTEEFRIQTSTSGGYGGDAILNLVTGQYGNSGVYFGDSATYTSQPAHVKWIDVSNILEYNSNGVHIFKYSGSEKMRISTAGDVGIGTTSPSRKLHVAGTARVDSTFYLGTDSACAFFRYYNSLIITNTANTNISLGGGPGNVNNNVFVGNGYLDVNGYIRGKNYFYLEDANGTVRTTLRSESTYATLDNGTNTLNTIANAHVFLRSSTEVMRIHTNNNVGIGTTLPGEKLEVNGSVKATASTDAYKGYIKQNVISFGAEKVENSNYYFTSYNTTSTVTSAQAYNRTVAAYSGRVKKVYIRHGGGLTPTATAVNFKKHTNGTTSSTIYSATVANSAGANMSAYYEFGNNDFTFSAGDLIGLLYQTTDAFGTASKTMGQVAVTITLEYNIT